MSIISIIWFEIFAELKNESRVHQLGMEAVMFTLTLHIYSLNLCRKSNCKTWALPGKWQQASHALVAVRNENVFEHSCTTCFGLLKTSSFSAFFYYCVRVSVCLFKNIFLFFTKSDPIPIKRDNESFLFPLVR